MEGNGRMYANVGGGMLGLEMPLNPSQKHPQMVGFNIQQQDHQQTQLSMKQPNYTYNNINQNQNQNQNPPQKTRNHSDEDEANGANDENTLDGKRKNISPWQRMKWTDNMVKLLIMAVYYIGDEAGFEFGTEKKKSGGGGGGGGCSGGSGGGGVLQKKGKWKSVSRAMMEKGFYVSPQQCEDKFNDLNKRYKRVNDILGKGTACRVVENQNLLDSMELSTKLKEEARKLLNSKHLFFREMCAYHNSCGHVNVTPHDGSNVISSTHHQHPQLPSPQPSQSCLHSPPNAPPKMDEHDEEEEDEEEEDEEEDESEEEEEDEDEGGVRKRGRTTLGGVSSNGWQQLSSEVIGLVHDGSKSSWEKKQWVMNQLVQFEEQGVKFQFKALELEKQRLKWVKFSSKKEREMEKKKIDNERNRLENERMVILLKKKEIELLIVEKQQGISNPSSVSGLN